MLRSHLLQVLRVLTAGFFEVFGPSLAEQQAQVAFQGDTELMDAGQARIEIFHTGTKNEPSADLRNLLHFLAGVFGLLGGWDTGPLDVPIGIGREVLYQVNLGGWIMLNEPPVLETLDDVVTGSFASIGRQVGSQVFGDDV